MLESVVNRVIASFDFLMPYIAILLVVAIFFVFSRFFLVSLRRKMLKNAKNKQQISDIKIFSRIFNVVVFCIILSIALFSYTGSWSGLGIFAGLLTAGLGFALQKPITGIAAWLMIVIKRPFRVGDRVKIGETKGEIYDITLTHIYIDETGGMAETEDHSGRNIMVPNHKLFENDIINYTLTHDLIIGEISLLLSFKSNIDKSIKIINEVLDKEVKKFSDQLKKAQSIRATFKDNGIVIRALFYAPVYQMNDIKSKITLEIYNKIKKDKNINFAAPDGRDILNK
ncbi:MAG: mechanosensitive ion channel family protein [Nanoarchaeota archaeon]